VDDARNVRQKSRTKDGKSVSEDWSRSHSVHTQFRMLSLTAVETLLETLKLADASFQQIVRNVNFERWQEYANTNFLYLHQIGFGHMMSSIARWPPVGGPPAMEVAIEVQF
jgi:hypothetical protein